MLKLLPILILMLIANPVLAVDQVPLSSQFQSAGNVPFESIKDISLGKDTYRGVVASAYLKPMPNIPGGESYLLSVVFSAQNKRNKLVEGDVAVKITSSNGKSGNPIRLNQVDETFQTEIQLSMDGETQLTIGSKLVDKKKRIYRFFFTPGL